MTDPFALKYGPWAVVAGASDGVGAAFAEGLAQRELASLTRNETVQLMTAAINASMGPPA